MQYRKWRRGCVSIIANVHVYRHKAAKRIFKQTLNLEYRKRLFNLNRVAEKNKMVGVRHKKNDLNKVEVIKT